FSDEPVLKLNNFQIWDLASEDSKAKSPSVIKMLPATLSNDDTKKILDELSKNPSSVSLLGSLPVASTPSSTGVSPSAPEPAYDPKSGVVVSGIAGAAKSGSVSASGVTMTGPVVLAPKKSVYVLVLSDGRVVRINGKPDPASSIVVGQDATGNPVEVKGDLFRKLSDAENEFLDENKNSPISYAANPLDAKKPPVLQATIAELSGDAGKESGRIFIKRSDESYREKVFKEGKVVSDIETLYDAGADSSLRAVADDHRIVRTYFSDTDFSSVTYQRFVLNKNGENVGISDEPFEAKLPSGLVLSYKSGVILDSSRNAVDPESLSGLDKAFYFEVRNLHKKYVVREVLDGLRFYGTEYSGIAAFSSLFIPEEFLQDWQKTIENAFCKSIIGGGIDCWTSKICKKYDDSIAGYGVLTTASESSSAFGSVPVAHVEAERSLPGVFQNGSVQTTEFLYKITYYVRNPESAEDLHYNLVFLPRGYQAFTKSKLLKPGQSGSAAGQASIVQYSRQLYTEVCLVFDREIADSRGEKVSEVCNNICGGVIDVESGECNALETAVWSPNIPVAGSSGTSAPAGSGDFQNF
ncbi:MAG: hypothetical protein Q7K43_02175, partial [Candidatus Woesearchaeota archaeon]|nr:hypothetical protein [Candidatus Woesearchaeota archaeon]